MKTLCTVLMTLGLAGCASVGVSYGAHEPAGFDALRPRLVAHSVAELHRWLAEHA